MNPIDERRVLLTRRELLGRSSLGLGGAALATLLGRDLWAGEGEKRLVPHFAPKAKRVIYLFMNGAPTHVDLFDWKPKLQEMHGKPVPPEYLGTKRFSTMTTLTSEDARRRPSAALPNRTIDSSVSPSACRADATRSASPCSARSVVVNAGAAIFRVVRVESDRTRRGGDAGAARLLHAALRDTSDT